MRVVILLSVLAESIILKYNGIVNREKNSLGKYGTLHTRKVKYYSEVSCLGFLNKSNSTSLFIWRVVSVGTFKYH